MSRPDYIPLPTEVLLDQSLTPDDIVWLLLLILQHAETPGALRTGPQAMHRYRDKIPAEAKRGQMSARLKQRGYITQARRATKHMPQGGTWTDLGPRILEALPSHWLRLVSQDVRSEQRVEAPPENQGSLAPTKPGVPLTTISSSKEEQKTSSSVLLTSGGARRTNLPKGWQGGPKPERRETARQSAERQQAEQDALDPAKQVEQADVPEAPVEPEKAHPVPRLASDGVEPEEPYKTRKRNPSPVEKLVAYFDRLASACPTAGPNPTNRSALGRSLRQWMHPKDANPGLTSREVEVMIEKFWAPGYQRKGSTPWLDFVNQRTNLAANVSRIALAEKVQAERTREGAWDW